MYSHKLWVTTILVVLKTRKRKVPPGLKFTLFHSNSRTPNYSVPSSWVYLRMIDMVRKTTFTCACDTGSRQIQVRYPIYIWNVTLRHLEAKKSVAEQTQISHLKFSLCISYSYFRPQKYKNVLSVEFFAESTYNIKWVE